MTNKATIATVNGKVVGVEEKVNRLVNSFNTQMGTLRRRIGAALGISHEGKRDLYDVYGYPRSLGGSSGFDTMYAYSRRQGIANRITFGIAKKCWRDGFEIYQSSDDKADQIMIDEMNALNKAGLTRKIERADTLNRIGRFSAMYVGVPDGRESTEPVGTVVNGAASLENLYFSPYAYDGIEIEQQDNDPKSPRYGLPERYRLQQINKQNDKDTQPKSIIAHWSRVVHFNENALESDIEGMGGLEPVFNRILDLEKATGGSSEAYFRNAKRIIGYEIDKDFAADFINSEEKQKKFNEKVEQFTNEFQDHTLAAGAKLKEFSSNLASPEYTVKAALWEISGYTGIPIRILTGEGSGQLAGSEDQLAMNQIIADRQRLQCRGWLVRTFEILEAAGMLTLPDTYDIRFPPQQAATDREVSENADRKAGAIQKLAAAKSQPGGDNIDMESALASCGLSDVELEGDATVDGDQDLEEAAGLEPEQDDDGTDE